MDLFEHVDRTKIGDKSKGCGREFPCLTELPVMRSGIFLKAAGGMQSLHESEIAIKVGFRYFLLVLNLTRKINPLVINTVRVTSNISITLSSDQRVNRG
jgi:hypothetical protein